MNLVTCPSIPRGAKPSVPSPRAARVNESLTESQSDVCVKLWNTYTIAKTP